MMEQWKATPTTPPVEANFAIDRSSQVQELATQLHLTVDSDAMTLLLRIAIITIIIIHINTHT